MKAEVSIEMLRYFLSTSMGRIGMTRSELADRTGISMKEINNYFRGNSELSENDLYKIMNAILEKNMRMKPPGNGSSTPIPSLKTRSQLRRIALRPIWRPAGKWLIWIRP